MMSKTCLIPVFLILHSCYGNAQNINSWIRVNQLGYNYAGPKVAVLGSKTLMTIKKFEVVDNNSKKVVFSGSPGRSFGAYGPFKDTYRLNFTSFNKKGKYFIRAGNAKSTPFEIGDNVYDSAADFCLKYMRQQRSGFNPYLKDSCHTYDGYTLFAPVP